MKQKAHVLRSCLCLLALSCCAGGEPSPRAADTSLPVSSSVPGTNTAPTGPQSGSQNGSQGGSQSGPSETAASFTGVSISGVWLQGTQGASACLQAQDDALTLSSPLVLGPCSNNGRQSFYAARGTFCLAPDRCLSSAFKFGAPMVLDVAPVGLPDAYYGEPEPSAFNTAWVLSSDTGTLYHNQGSQGTWAAHVGQGGGASDIQMAPLGSTQPVATLAVTTPPGRPIRIYSNASGGGCLTEGVSSPAITACEAGNSQQLWQIASHQFIGISGRCLTGVTRTNSATHAPCAAASSDPNQRWYFAKGHIILEVPYGYPNSFALVLNDAGDGNVLLKQLVGDSAGWSLGAENFLQP